MSRPAQIRAFNAEVEALAAEGVALDAGSKARIAAHHQELLARLSREEGVDVTTAEEKLSLGMRLASFVGAVALSAAVFFLFYRFWGALAVPSQVAILVAGPLLLVGVTHLLHQWERTGYFATLAALAAFAAFVLDLGALGTIFNLPETPHAFLAWGLFGILLGWNYRLRLPHFAGLICVALWVTSLPGWFHAEQVPDVFGRGEALILAGALFLAKPYLVRRFGPRWTQLPWPIDLRVVGMIALFLGTFILSVEGRQSWLPLDSDLIEGFYQAFGFLISGLIIAWGVRDGHTELANGGIIFLTVMCLVKATDWWWNWLPHWLFFLLLAGLAIGVMVALKRVRNLMMERTA